MLEKVPFPDNFSIPEDHYCIDMNRMDPSFPDKSGFLCDTLNNMEYMASFKSGSEGHFFKAANVEKPNDYKCTRNQDGNRICIRTACNVTSDGKHSEMTCSAPPTNPFPKEGKLPGDNIWRALRTHSS